MSLCFAFRVKGRCGGRGASVEDADVVMGMGVDVGVDVVN